MGVSYHRLHKAVVFNDTIAILHDSNHSPHVVCLMLVLKHNNDFLYAYVQPNPIMSSKTYRITAPSLSIPCNPSRMSLPPSNPDVPPSNPPLPCPPRPPVQIS